MMIYLWSQNTPQFPISLFIGAKSLSLEHFFLGLQTASSRWGPDLENRVGAIHVVLISWSACDTVHCLGESALFFFICGIFFLHFLPSDAPIMLYNICYWWFSFFQGNHWTKTLRIPKYVGQNLACWCLRLWSLWTAFTCCYPLSWLTIWLRSEVVDSYFIHCNIFVQKLFVVLKQWQTMLWIVDLFLIDCGTHFEHSFFIDKCSCKMVPSDIFNSSTILHNFNLQSAKMSLWSFLVF